MEWLKQGMQFKDKDGVVKTLSEIGKSSTGETTYIYKKDSFGGSYAYYPEGIDWEETAKLNRIDLDFIERNGKVLNEIEQRNKNTLSVTDLKQKKEKFKKEEIINNKIEELVKDCNISDFMKTIQLMAKEKIKNNDDVYLVSYYVDLYKFIEDLKHSYMHR